MSGPSKPPSVPPEATERLVPAPTDLPLEPLSSRPRDSSPMVAKRVASEIEFAFVRAIFVERWRRDAPHGRVAAGLLEFIRDEVDQQVGRSEGEMLGMYARQQKQIRALDAQFRDLKSSNQFVYPRVEVGHQGEQAAKTAPGDLELMVRDLLTADEDPADLLACYSSLRVSLGKEREALRVRSQDLTRQYALGLLYDAMGWTKSTELDRRALEALAQAVRIAVGPTLSEDDFLGIRRILQRSLFRLGPPIEGDDVDDLEEEERGSVPTV
jgi:hypothetical protein